MLHQNKTKAKNRYNSILNPFLLPNLLEHQKQSIYCCGSASKRVSYENYYSRPLELASGKAIDQVKSNKSARKGSYSYPYGDVASSYRLRDLYYLSGARPIFVSNSNNSGKVPTEQEKIAFLNQTRESSRKNSLNNNNDEELLSCEEVMSEYDRQISIIGNALRPYPTINEFNLYENALKRPMLHSTGFHRLGNPQGEPLFLPNPKYIDDIELEIKRVSSMKRPYNKFSPFNLATQLSPQYLHEENTEILSVHVKVNENEVLMFKVKRFDDLFNTIKLFCEINAINEGLIKPLIMQVVRVLNQIYQAMNYQFENEDSVIFELIKMVALKKFKDEKQDII